MVCLADFPDGTGAPGASWWLPLQSRGDVKLDELDKCGYDPGPRKWRENCSWYWLKGVTWLLGKPGAPFDPKCRTQRAGQRYISASGFRELREQIGSISMTKSWLEALKVPDRGEEFLEGKLIISGGMGRLELTIRKPSPLVILSLNGRQPTTIPMTREVLYVVEVA